MYVIPQLIIPAAVDRHAQQERPGTEFGQLAQEKLQIDPFLVPLERAEKSLVRPGVSLPEHFLAKFAVPLFVIQPELVVVGMSTVQCVRLPVQHRPIQRPAAARRNRGRGLFGVFPEITHHAPVILVAEDRIVHDSQGENRVIAGEARGGSRRPGSPGRTGGAVDSPRSLGTGASAAPHPA